MRVYFLLYRKDGRIGNDLSLIEPFKWLLETRKKYPDSDLAVEKWSEINVSQGEWGYWDSVINIDVDEKRIVDFKQYKSEKVGGESFDEWKVRLAKEVEELKQRKTKEAEEKIKAEELKQKRLAGMAKAREAKKAKVLEESKKEKQKDKSVLGINDIGR